GKLTQPCPIHRITARPHIGSMVHVGSGVWRAPKADRSPMFTERLAPDDRAAWRPVRARPVR
ncbi:MAG: hypothetical protein WBL53_14450, partial [Pseudonocardiaceae bacterium]